LRFIKPGGNANANERTPVATSLANNVSAMEPANKNTVMQIIILR
jgi:hypothetical protein